MEIYKIAKSKKPKRIVRTSIVVSIIVLFVGVLGMTTLASLKTPPSEAKIGERHLQVEVCKVEQEDVPIVITGYGQVTVLNVVPIAPEVAGKIVAIHPRLEVGETIPKGGLLFKIDPTDHMNARRASRRRLSVLERSHELAQKAHARVLELFEKNSVGTLSGVEAAEKAMLSIADQINLIAQVLETAETNLKRCEVRAPFNARIKSVSLEKGQYVIPGENILTLADDAVLEILVPLMEGMFCSVKIPGKILHNVIQLPRHAVSFENTVYLAVNNRLKTVPVKTACTEGENAYVSDGLNTGDRVVTTRLIGPLENTLLQIQ